MWWPSGWQLEQEEICWVLGSVPQKAKCKLAWLACVPAWNVCVPSSSLPAKAQHHTHTHTTQHAHTHTPHTARFCTTTLCKRAWLACARLECVGVPSSSRSAKAKYHTHTLSISYCNPSLVRRTRGLLGSMGLILGCVHCITPCNIQPNQRDSHAACNEDHSAGFLRVDSVGVQYYTPGDYSFNRHISANTQCCSIALDCAQQVDTWLWMYGTNAAIRQSLLKLVLITHISWR